MSTVSTSFNWMLLFSGCFRRRRFEDLATSSGDFLCVASRKHRKPARTAAPTCGPHGSQSFRRPPGPVHKSLEKPHPRRCPSRPLCPAFVVGAAYRSPSSVPLCEPGTSAIDASAGSGILAMRTSHPECWKRSRPSDFVPGPFAISPSRALDVGQQPGVGARPAGPSAQRRDLQAVPVEAADRRPRRHTRRRKPAPSLDQGSHVTLRDADIPPGGICLLDLAPAR